MVDDIAGGARRLPEGAAEGIQLRQTEIATLVSQEVGMLFAYSNMVQVGLPVQSFVSIADVALSFPLSGGSRSLPAAEAPRCSSRAQHTLRERGVQREVDQTRDRPRFFGCGDRNVGPVVVAKGPAPRSCSSPCRGTPDRVWG